MGSVRKEGKSWYIVYDIRDNGTRKQKKKRGYKTKKEAQKALVEIENSLNKGLYFEPSNTPFGIFLTDWFKTKQNMIGDQTAKLYQGYLKNRIIPALGEIPVSKLTTLHIQNFLNDLTEEGLTDSTVKKIFNIIRNALEHANDLEMIMKNSASKVKLPKGSKKEMLVWNEGEIKRFLKTGKEDRYYVAFELALLTGMRQGEILGLRWKDIDLINGYLVINQTLSHDGKTFLVGGKTKSSRRNIHLPNSTIEVLKKHKVTVNIEKESNRDIYTNNDLVVCTQVGTPLNPANLRRSFNKLVKAAQVPQIRFHDLRHSHATLLLSKGVNIKVISERLGHSNIKVTLDTYSHVLPTMQEDAIKKLEGFVLNSSDHM